MKRIFELARETWNRYEAHGDLLAAAIAFYTLLSVAPLVVIAVTLAGLAFDPTVARDTLLHSVALATNADVADIFLRLVTAAQHSNNKLASILAGLLLLWAASRLFLQIQGALNLIWGVRPNDGDSTREVVLRVALKRLISFALVLGSAGLLLVTLMVHALIDVLSHLIQRFTAFATVSETALALGQEFILPIVLLVPSVAVIFRVLPDARIKWREVWVGASLTSLLLIAGTWLLGRFLSKLSPAWLQGAIGSIALFMIWTYYLAQVFLLGAAFTRVWSHGRDIPIEPQPYAKLESVPARRE